MLVSLLTYLLSHICCLLRSTPLLPRPLPSLIPKDVLWQGRGSTGFSLPLQRSLQVRRGKPFCLIHLPFCIPGTQHWLEREKRIIIPMQAVCCMLPSQTTCMDVRAYCTRCHLDKRAVLLPCLRGKAYFSRMLSKADQKWYSHVPYVSVLCQLNRSNSLGYREVKMEMDLILNVFL